MITAILILTMFNTGLIILLTASALSIFRAENAKMLNIALHHVDETYTELGTWIYNMDSTKQKVEMSGKAEL